MKTLHPSQLGEPIHDSFTLGRLGKGEIEPVAQQGNGARHYATTDFRVNTIPIEGVDGQRPFAEGAAPVTLDVKDMDFAGGAV